MKKNTCFVMLAALMLAGCNNEVDEQVMDSKRVPLQINGNINMLMTRAANEHWDDNDAIGVYMVGADNSIVEGVENKRYKITNRENGDFAPDGENNTAYFPEDRTVNVVAYYPYGDVVENKLSLDLAKQDEQPKIDLMAAKATDASKSNPAVKLEFKHRLTKLFFEIEGDVNTDGIEATISNQYTKIQYDILNDTLLIADGSEKEDIAMKYWNNNSRFTEAIVLPNGENNSPGERKLTFKLNGKTFSAKISDATTFVAGKKYTYKVTFTKEGSVNIQGAGITNWDTENEGPETEVKPDIYITGGAIGDGWHHYYKMDKKPDNIYVWTGKIKANEEFKFTFEETYDLDKEQIMSSDQTNVGPVTLQEGTESNIYKVVYANGGPDNKWKVTEDGTYMVKLDMGNNKISIEKISILD